MSSPIWAYLDQAGAVSLASSFAQEFVRLRNELAPNVLLAYHMSGWAMRHDIVYEDRPMRPCARTRRSRRRSTMRCTRNSRSRSRTSQTETPASTRRSRVNANTWFTPADFARHLLYAKTFVRLAEVRMVAWQIPLGNTVMRAMHNTWDHYQDNRVQWLLGSDSRARLREYVAAAFVGFLFGRGAEGATCACDAAADGVTNPAPIDGNTQESVSADDGGGYFKQQSAAYYRAGATALP